MVSASDSLGTQWIDNVRQQNICYTRVISVKSPRKKDSMKVPVRYFVHNEYIQNTTLTYCNIF